MELRHLETFRAVVRLGSFVRAAEALQYAQSTITLQMQQLEQLQQNQMNLLISF